MGTPAPTASRPTLVDGAETALRNWLAPGRHRPGDRLPPEHDLAAMLGVSRGTLRAALERLERSGEIVRRQGSGTFVASVAQPAALREGLERLVSYARLARARGVRLSAVDVRVEQVRLATDDAHAFRTETGAEATRVARTILADGEPAAVMEDVVHPDVELPPPTRLRTALQRGDMVLDVLIDQTVPIAFATTRILPRLLEPADAAARALGVAAVTATLELEATYHLTSGAAVQRSRDVFAPERLDLHVMRWLDAQRPAQVGAGA
ncbi:MAG TPA: GntR family transcriptional regulator [Conexibacter sp.]|nr:GntR family transcriptional regulator [Conexibacter sp.]